MKKIMSYTSKHPIKSGLILISLIIVFPILIDWLIFGNNLYSNLDNSEWSSFLGSYIGSLIAGLCTIFAVLLSLDRGKIIQEKAEIRENSLIVYYDITLGLRDVNKLYNHHINGKSNETPTRMFYSKTWNNNVALISSCLENSKDIDDLYKLYGDLEMVKAELDLHSDKVKINGDDLRTILNRIHKKYFKAGEVNDENDIEEFLNPNYAKIIRNVNNIVKKSLNRN